VTAISFELQSCGALVTAANMIKSKTTVESLRIRKNRPQLRCFRHVNKTQSKELRSESW